MTRKLSISIISDLHCHPSNNGTDDTYLKTDLLKSPISSHPVESVKKLIKDNDITTDITICPGDFTNKSDVQGFISGWDFSLEIHQELKGKEIIATIGNHDVDSHGIHSNYSITTAKGIMKGFPIESEDECDVFWSRGYVILERDDYRILVINSSHFHHNKTAATTGKIGDDLIEYIEDFMQKKDDQKISIALAHHHPVDHSRFDLGEHDTIVNGNDLMEVLGKYKFDLFIHGHKHDPLLRYHNLHSNNHKIPILSSGSFSATTNISFTSQRNTFHRVELIKYDNKPCKGRVTTWTFIPKNGWKIINDDQGFDAHTGFGYLGVIDDLASEIIKLMKNKKLVSWQEIVIKIPDINYLIPTEAKELEIKLKSQGYILSPRISMIPECISNLNLI